MLVTVISNKIMAESKELPINLENYLNDVTSDGEFINSLTDNLTKYNILRDQLEQLDKIADKLGIK
jgi:hypothetical protein